MLFTVQAVLLLVFPVLVVVAALRDVTPEDQNRV